jgi:predicted nucleic acid-binding protein
MVIVDTSIWVDSLRTVDARLNGWIAAEQLLQHPFVTAEIGMGSFRSAIERAKMIDLLESFVQLDVAKDKLFHSFVADKNLFGTGIGFADAHLLQACKANPAAQLATRDKRLVEQAERLGIEIA